MSQPRPRASQVLAIRPTSGTFASLFSIGEDEPRLPTLAEIKARRAAVFHEGFWRKPIRLARAGLAAYRADGLKGVWAALDLMLREKSIAADGLPACDSVLTSPDGLVGAARDLTIDGLMTAYGRGLLPASYLGAAWWRAPMLRAILRTSDAQTQGRTEPCDLSIAFDLNFETAFSEGPARDLPECLKWAFCALHDAGFAHNFEFFNRAGLRMGSGFGVAVGDIFVLHALHSTESQDPAQARALVGVLARRLEELGYAIVDGGVPTNAVMALGFAPTTRATYNERVVFGLAREKIGLWRNRPKQAA